MNEGRRSGRGERLTRAEDFQTIFRTGGRHSSSIATIFTRSSSAGVRLGIVAGRRLGAAVVRNRVRRRVRAAFRRVRPRMSRSADVVIVPKKAAERASFPSLVAVVEQALQEAGLLGGDSPVRASAGAAPPHR